MIFDELNNWTLCANYPYVPELTRAAETGHPLNCIFEPIPASVPGCVHNDLLKAGLIADPYYEMDSLKSAWVADCWWTYQTAFRLDPSLRNLRLRLRLSGVDYAACVNLNGRGIGEHAGMFVPFVRDITALADFGGENRLTVLLKESPDEMGQIGYTGAVCTQKARFAYKWDFSTRLVQAGLYDRALLEHFGSAAVEWVKADASVEGSTGKVQGSVELTMFRAENVRMEYQLLYDGVAVAACMQQVALAEGAQTAEFDLALAGPQLWYPNGAGGQPVYTLRVSVYDSDGLSDRAEQVIGFRTLEYARAEGAPADCLPYGLVVNGKRVYIKGVNVVPLDIMYGRVREGDVARMLTQVRDANCNLVRVWGGGLIESERFYGLCDRLGLLVWQEFPHSGSGIDSRPSEDPAFLALCRRTAIHAVREKRNHPCLAFWCGGNELQGENNVPLTAEHPLLRMLGDVVREYDGRTLFLPTSATGPYEFLDLNRRGQNFDVHGPWKYEGPEAHYDLYNRSDSQLHSEFGVGGMTNESAMERFLSPGHRKAQDMSNPVWRHHGEWWDTYARDAALFGPAGGGQLREFILSSQFIQAEGLRYAIEANRRRAFQNVGSILWQFNEPWPNVSCTNLVDYYGQPKLAYYAVAQAFRPVNPSLRYEKLLCAPGEALEAQAWLSSDEDTREWLLSAQAFDGAGRALASVSSSVEVGEGRSARGETLRLAVPETNRVLIEVTAACGTSCVRNHYLLLVRGRNGCADRAALDAAAGMFLC